MIRVLPNVLNVAELHAVRSDLPILIIAAIDHDALRERYALSLIHI